MIAVRKSGLNIFHGYFSISLNVCSHQLYKQIKSDFKLYMLIGGDEHHIHHVYIYILVEHFVLDN